MAINSKAFRARNGLSVGDDTSVVDSINSTGKWTGGALNPDKGGTGLTSYAVGDILYSGVTVTTPSAGTTVDQTLSKLSIGSAGKIIRSTGTAPSWTTSTFPDAASATVGTFLRSDGTNFINSTLILPNSSTVDQLLFSSSTNTVGEITKANSSILVTNASGTPSWSVTLPAHTVTTSVTVPTIYAQAATGGTLTLRANAADTTGTVSITTATTSTNTSTGALIVAGGVGIAGNTNIGGTLSVTGNVTFSGTGNSVGTITSGTWQGSILGTAYGGTGANLSALTSNGGIVYSTSTTLSVLAGTATANKILLSGASGAPSWSTATYPTTVTGSGKFIVSTANDTFGVSTASFPTTAGTAGTLLRSDGTNIVNTTLTMPTTITSNSFFYASAANTLTATTNLTWNESVLNLGASVLLKVNNAATAGNTILGINSGNTGHEYKSIIGGFGIDITNGSGTITISQSGAVAGATVPNASTFGTFKIGQNLIVGAISTAVSKTITNVTWVSTGGGTATYTSASHGLTNGTAVSITGILVSGSTANTYNGIYTVANVTINTFDVVIGTNPGTYQSGGTIYYTYSSLDSTSVLDLRVGGGTSGVTNLITGYSSNDQTTRTFSVSTSGQITATDKLSVSKNDTTNNASVSVAKFTHATTGTPAIGIGTLIELETETTAGNKVGTSLESIATNIGSGTEVFEFRVNNINAGASASNLVVRNGAIYGGTTASYNLTISPTTNGTNGILTLTDVHQTQTAGTTTISGTISNSVIDSSAKASFRTVKYIVQITQGTVYESKEILVLHDGTTAVWTESATLTMGTITGSLTYDFNVGATNLEFRMSGTSLPTTIVKVSKIAMTQ